MKAKMIMTVSVLSIFLASCKDGLLDRKADPLKLDWDRKLESIKFNSDPAPAAFFIAGTYAATEQADYCSTWDTLWIVKSQQGVNTYTIARKTTFQRNQADHYFPVERYQQTWIGSYDSGGKIMQAINSDKVITVKPAESTLVLDSQEFKKVE